jgi:hypothetical protein
LAGGLVLKGSAAECSFGAQDFFHHHHHHHLAAAAATLHPIVFVCCYCYCRFFWFFLKENNLGASLSLESSSLAFFLDSAELSITLCAVLVFFYCC